MNVVGALIKVALIFALLAVTLKVIGRYGGMKGRTRSVGRPVEIVGRSPLARHASLVLVRMGERCYALGVSDTSVNLLTEVEVAFVEPTPSPARTPGKVPGPTWRALMDSLRDRTVRR